MSPGWWSQENGEPEGPGGWQPLLSLCPGLVLPVQLGPSAARAKPGWQQHLLPDAQKST